MPDQGIGAAHGPGIPNGYGVRISRLRQQIKQGVGDKKQKQLRNRISNLRSERYLKGQKNRPDPTLPFDAQYDTTVSGLARNRDVALQNNAYQRQQTQSMYGFDNPLANPYSKAALLQRSFDQFNRGTVNSAAASGQLYSGSTQSALDTGLYNFGQDWNAAQSDYQNELRALTDKDVAAQNEYQEGVQAAEAKRLASALEQEIDPDAAPDTPDSVKNYIQSQRKRIRKLDKKGRDNKADKLRKKLRRLGVNSGR